MRLSRISRVALFALVVVLALFEPVSAQPGMKLSEKYPVARVSDQYSDVGTLENSYYRYRQNGFAAAPPGSTVRLSPAEATRQDDRSLQVRTVSYAEPAGGESTADALIWDDAASAHAWQFEAPEAGLYQIDFRYVPLENTLDLLYGIQIDGSYPFSEAESIRLKNCFQPDGHRIVNEFGDELPMKSQQVACWQQTSAYDVNGIFSEPLQFFLEAGQHTLTMVFKSGRMVLADILLRSSAELPTYAEYALNGEAAGFRAYTGAAIRLEAEASSYRSRSSLLTDSSHDPTVSPYEVGRKVQNVLNGWNYRQGNDEITWVVEIPEDGRYKLVLRGWQNYYTGSVIYRQLLIDGAVPFAEAAEMAIEGTGQNFQITVLGGSEPALLNLSKGTHRITLRTTMGALEESYYRLLQYSHLLSQAIFDIQALTGSHPDPDLDYELDEKMPWALEQIRDVYTGILAESEVIEDLCGKTSEMVTTMRSYAGDLAGMVEKPRQITRQMSILNTIQGQIGGWTATLRDSPLQLDYIELLAPESEPMVKSVSAGTRLLVMWTDFLNSFRKTNAADVDQTDETVIEVWTAREREFGEVIQRLADTGFTPASGIRVKMNILGAGSVGVVNTTSPLTLALVSGDSPDVVMGSDSITPVELAIRKSAFNLEVFADFPEVAARFPRGAIVPFEYQDATFALPDTIDLPVLLYRKDILQSIGLAIPETWDELTTRTLPVLRQFNMNFSLNATANKSAVAASDIVFHFMMFYQQRGGKLYNDSRLDSTLDSDLAFQSFSQYVDLYNRYDIEIGQNFYNQFINGRIPLAVGGLYDYLQLDVAAPGIYGKWDIAPIPGTKDDSGQIDRSSCGTVTSSMVFDSHGKAAQGWAFLKWWTATETQIAFSHEIESLIGPEARWFSANSEALLHLRWSDQGRESVAAMLASYRNVPNTLGGYMTNRALTNAFTRVVINQSQKTRDALEQAYREIKAEILRKNREYGVVS